MLALVAFITLPFGYFVLTGSETAFVLTMLMMAFVLVMM